MLLNDNEIAALWKTFKKGDKEAFGCLATIFYKILYNYGTKLCNDTTLVEDCLQDLFLDLWKRREFLAETEHVKYYLLKSIRRKIHLAKKTSGKLMFPSMALDAEAHFIGEFSIEFRIIENEIREEQWQKLKRVLDKLTKREREIIYLKFYQGMEYEQIANIMSINYQSARNLVHTAIKDLKDVWNNAQP